MIPEVSRYLADHARGLPRTCTNFMDLVLPVQVLGRFDVSDELTRFSGQDPSRFQKATFLAATHDRRVQMAVKTHAANIQRAAAELPVQLQAIACDTRLTHKERRAILVSLAREMDPNTPRGRERRRHHHRLRRPIRRRRPSPAGRRPCDYLRGGSWQSDAELMQ